MKKLIFILLASFFLVQTTHAEMFQWGIKAGLGINSLKIADLTGIEKEVDVYDLITGKSVMGYHVGVTDPYQYRNDLYPARTLL